MLEFQLFRIKVLFPQQMTFEPPPSRSQLVRAALDSLPSAELRRNMVWHVGNVEPIDEDALYFRVGRTTTATIEVFESGSFVDQTFETAPYTHAIIDLPSEVCAIAKKPRLSPRSAGIGHQLVKLLQHSEIALRHEAEFEIGEINDPEDFISHLRSAYSISKFTVWFSQPNPFDVNEDFIRPAQRLVRASNSERGKTELKGQHLTAPVLEDISRSAAATGDDAVAWLKPAQSRRRVKKRLKGNPVVLQQEHVDDGTAKKAAIQRVREVYQRLRHRATET